MTSNKKMMWTRLASVILLMSGAAITQTGQFAQADTSRPFNLRQKATQRGDLVVIGNNLLTCLAGTIGSLGIACEVAQGASDGTGVDNNHFDMRNLDVDGDPSTFNSSSANLNLPAGAQVTFAGLYWGAFSSTQADPPTLLDPARTTVKLRAPGASSYTDLNASQVDDIFITITGDENGGNAYQGFADVTQLVQAAGSGSYTIANVLAVQGRNRYAGWALVVIYSNPAEPLRDVVIYDGFKFDSSFTPVSIPLSSFLTPATGPVSATLSVYAYDGDRGNTSDQLLLNTTVISDALNPANNPFNSTISNRGVNVVTRNPSHLNTMGVDLDSFDASNILQNNATTATVTIVLGADKILPGLVTFSTPVFQPAMQISAQVSDENGGEVNPDDTLLYTLVMTNAGAESAIDTRMTVTMPSGTTFVNGSVNLLSNAGGTTGVQTDAANDDLAEVSGGKITLRLGASSSASTGGTMAVNSVASVQYRVKVNNPIANQIALVNQTEMIFHSASNPSAALTSSNTLTLLAVAKVRVRMPIIVR